MEKDLQRLEVELARGAAFAEFQFLWVNFPTANTAVTVKHQLEGPPSDVIYAIMGVRLTGTAPTASPTVYELATTPRGERSLKLYATEPGIYRLLVAIAS